MKKSSLVATTLSLMCLTASVQAKEYNLVFFGDSSTDSGNTPDLAYGPGSFSPPFGAYITKFGNCNGAMWSTTLAKLRDLNLQPSRNGGTNYAVDGAPTYNVPQSVTAPAPPGDVFLQMGEINTSPDFGPITPFPIATGLFFTPSFVQQVGDFLSTHQYNVSKRSPVFQTTGSTELSFDPNVDLTGQESGAAIVANYTALYDAGYKNQVYLAVAGSKDFFASLNPPAINGFFDGQNQFVIQGTKDLHTLIIDKTLFDADVLSNTAQYGMLPFSQADLFAPGGGAMLTITGPNNVPFWWDDNHVSEVFNHLVAEYVYAILEAPDLWANLSQQPFALMRGQNAVLRQQLYPIINLCECELYAFGSGMYAPQETAPIHAKDPSTSGWEGTLGLAYKFMPCLTLGIAGSYNQNYYKEKYYRGHYGFHLHSWVLSLLSGYQQDRGYLNGIFNFGFMKFNDIHRKFATGPVHWQAKGDTKGFQYDLLFEGGWFFVCNEDLRFGPFAAIEYQHDHIDGYKEHGASFNNLHYKSQHNHSFVTGVGLDLDWYPWYCCDPCDPGPSINLFLSANADWFTCDRHVYFRQPAVETDYSIEPGWGRWGVYNSATYFGSGGINFTMPFCKCALFTIGYRGDWGQHKMEEHFITASLTLSIW